MSMRLVIKDLLYGTEKNSGLKFLLFCAMFMVIIFRDTRELLMINVLHWCWKFHNTRNTTLIFTVSYSKLYHYLQMAFLKTNIKPKCTYAQNWY